MTSKTPTDEAVLFGQRIQQVRLARGTTLTALAERLRTSKSFLSNVENGKIVPSLTTILRLARALDCEVEELMTAFNRKKLKALFPDG